MVNTNDSKSLTPIAPVKVGPIMKKTKEVDVDIENMNLGYSFPGVKLFRSLN